MLEKLMKLYVMAMEYDVRSPMPHLFGPPGCGKSTAVEMLAELLGVHLHIINVSRLSPLEVEGVQMPHGSGEEMALQMLPATFWTSLKEGDILLLDEFLRGFPEVYNALLDIFTSRRAGAYRLPRVFIIGASNTTVAYDPALTDRLLHLKVPDPRKNKTEKKHLAQIIVDVLGLLPSMVDSAEMHSLLDTEVLPMYEVLDQLNGSGVSANSTRGMSVRNLIGQAQLREIQSSPLRELIDYNNRLAMSQGKAQYVLLVNGSEKSMPYHAGTTYETAAKKLEGNPRLTELQARNLKLNLQLVELESIRNETQEGASADDDVFE